MIENKLGLIPLVSAPVPLRVTVLELSFLEGSKPKYSSKWIVSSIKTLLPLCPVYQDNHGGAKQSVVPEFGVQVSHHGPIPGAGAQHDLWRFFVNKKLREMSGFWFRPNINTDGGAAAGPVEWPVVNETSAVNYSKHCSSSNILSETSNGPGNGNNWLCVPHLYWLYYLYLFLKRG